MKHTSRFRKIGYLSGPVNGEEVVRAWYQNARLPFFGTVYLKGFCDVVHQSGATGVVLTYRSAESGRTQIGDFTIYNLERREPSGVRYHAEAIRRMLHSFLILRREGVECVVLTEGANYWFLAALLRWMRIEVIASLHCQIRSPFESPRASHRLLHWLNSSFFFKRQRNPFMGVTRKVGEQVAEASFPIRPLYLRFFPTYDRAMFADLPPPPKSGPFVFVSAGRIEVNKGVLDLVDVASILRDQGYDFCIHLCGEGPALPLLKEKVRLQKLENCVKVHGFCDREKLLDLLATSHVIVVPTRTDFEEGLPKTCVEGVLAGRPVVTSRVCPVLEDIREAAIEVEPNDVDSYASAFIRLMSDQDLYEEKRSATPRVSQQFFDPANSYASVLQKALAIVEARTSAATS